MQKGIVAAVLAVVLLVSALLLGANPSPLTGLTERLALESPDGSVPVMGPADSLTENTPGGRLRLALSETGHFYAEDITVEITASLPGAEIYYTIDGAEPTEKSKRYTKPLEFAVSAGVSAIVLRAIAVSGDFITRPLTHTYFLGRSIDMRFDTLVFSLSTNDEYLYDYDTGIFVEGRLRDEYKAANPNAAWNINPDKPANFNMRGRDSEKPAYVEVFEPDGTRVVAQAAGLRVHGGWSRAEEQKSLRLIARKEYEPGVGKFHYGFFPGETICDDYGTPLNKYDSIVLRNGANDRNEAMLRNENASILAREAGFREVTPVRPCAVFLNGQYHGFAWIQAGINAQYLQDIYSAPTQEFDIVGDGETNLDENASLSARSALKTLNAYADKDLTDDAVFAELEALVDIDNLLWYYAYNIYLGNNDWPNNNLKRWRYTGQPFDGMAPELDGRWRYIMYDLDWSLGIYGREASEPTFRDVLGGYKSSPLLISLVKRRDMADKFTMILCSISSSLVTGDNVSRVIDMLYAVSSREIEIAIMARKYSNWASIDSIAMHHGRMMTYADARGRRIMGDLVNYFKYTDEMYDIKVSGGTANIGTVPGVVSRYFTALTVPVSPILDKFEVFDHWLLNGKQISEPEITVSAADAVNGVVSLELVTHEALPALVISEVYTGRRNGCVLTNTTDAAVSTAGLYLSNDPDNPFRWQIPAATVPAGGTLAFVGRSGADAGDLMKIKMDFNIQSGKVLILAHEDGTVWDHQAAG